MEDERNIINFRELILQYQTIVDLRREKKGRSYKKKTKKAERKAGLSSEEQPLGGRFVSMARCA